MTGAPTGSQFYYTPFTDEFDNGTVVLLHTKKKIEQHYALNPKINIKLLS